MRSFPGSALLESTLCGSIETTDDRQHTASQEEQRLWRVSDAICGRESPISFDGTSRTSSFLAHRHSYSESSASTTGHEGKNAERQMNPTSALFARALVSEVTDNPKTMTPAAMAEREKKLLKAQSAAKKSQLKKDGPRPIGVPGGIGQPNLLGSIAQALTGGPGESIAPAKNEQSSVLPPNSLQENRAQQQTSDSAVPTGKYSVTIGLSLSRRHSTVGHPDTVTRQTAFDFNELQDRQYKYVSSTDSSGWRAGGGERGGDSSGHANNAEQDTLLEEFGSTLLNNGMPGPGRQQTSNQQQQQHHKVAAPDTVHIPIIRIDADSPQAVDAIINALARGEVFIPHMAVLPEALSVNGISPPDLVVRFGCERNDDVPPDEWPNWCLEFMHNQLYEYFHSMGARWTKRPFSITLARKVRWKTVKHMNRYFAHAERVIDAWREKGPQYLDPQLSYIEGGATPEEVARPHGIYLLRNGIPTNYFPPNFDPPYTTKMTRSLLLNVLGKSWDKKRREWTGEPIPRLVTPSMLMAHMCGCADPGAGGFIANEVTHVNPAKLDSSSISDQRLITRDPSTPTKAQKPKASESPTSSSKGTPSPSPGSSASRSQPAGSPVARPQTSDPPASRSQAAGSPVARSQAAGSPVARSQAAGSPVARSQATRSPQKSFSPSKSHKIPARTSVDLESEEKKTDEYTPGEANHIHVLTTPSHNRRLKPASGASIDKPSTRRQTSTSTSSDFGATTNSVAASGTTVMHTNLSSKFVEKQSEWTGKSNWNEGKGTIVDSFKTPLASPWKYKSNEISPPKASPALTATGSGISLEYSMDSASMATNEMASSEMASSATASRSPNTSISQNQPPYEGTSYGVSSPRHSKEGTSYGVSSPRHSKASPTKSTASSSAYRGEEDQASASQSAFTLKESTSSEVPTDEELFVIGWAKALDPKSGNYYYFTLDRTKTVWENPLSTSVYVSHDTGVSSHTGVSSYKTNKTNKSQRRFKA